MFRSVLSLIVHILPSVGVNAILPYNLHVVNLVWNAFRDLFSATTVWISLTYVGTEVECIAVVGYMAAMNGSELSEWDHVAGAYRRCVTTGTATQLCANTAYISGMEY